MDDDPFQGTSSFWVSILDIFKGTVFVQSNQWNVYNLFLYVELDSYHWDMTCRCDTRQQLWERLICLCFGFYWQSMHLIITTITCTIYNVQDYFGQCLLLWIHTDFWNIAHLLKLFSLIIILTLVCVVTSRTLWSMCVSIQLKGFYLSFCLSFIWVLSWICMPRGLGGWRPTHL